MLTQCLPYFLISHKPVLRSVGLIVVGNAKLVDGPRRLAEGFEVFMRSLLSDELPLLHQKQR
jgi:hypothetical protein